MSNLEEIKEQLDELQEFKSSLMISDGLNFCKLQASSEPPKRQMQTQETDAGGGPRRPRTKRRKASELILEDTNPALDLHTKSKYKSKSKLKLQAKKCPLSQVALLIFVPILFSLNGCSPTALQEPNRMPKQYHQAALDVEKLFSSVEDGRPFGVNPPQEQMMGHPMEAKAALGDDWARRISARDSKLATSIGVIPHEGLQSSMLNQPLDQESLISSSNEQAELEAKYLDALPSGIVQMQQQVIQRDEQPMQLHKQQSEGASGGLLLNLPLRSLMPMAHQQHQSILQNIFNGTGQNRLRNVLEATRNFIKHQSSNPPPPLPSLESSFQMNLAGQADRQQAGPMQNLRIINQTSDESLAQSSSINVGQNRAPHLAGGSSNGGSARLSRGASRLAPELNRSLIGLSAPYERTDHLGPNNSSSSQAEGQRAGLMAAASGHRLVTNIAATEEHELGQGEPQERETGAAAEGEQELVLVAADNQTAYTGDEQQGQKQDENEHYVTQWNGSVPMGENSHPDADSTRQEAEESALNELSGHQRGALLAASGNSPFEQQQYQLEMGSRQQAEGQQGGESGNAAEVSGNAGNNLEGNYSGLEADNNSSSLAGGSSSNSSEPGETYVLVPASSFERLNMRAQQQQTAEGGAEGGGGDEGAEGGLNPMQTVQLPSQYDTVMGLPPEGHYDDYFKPSGSSSAGLELASMLEMQPDGSQTSDYKPVLVGEGNSTSGDLRNMSLIGGEKLVQQDSRAPHFVQQAEEMNSRAPMGHKQSGGEHSGKLRVQLAGGQHSSTDWVKQQRRETNQSAVVVHQNGLQAGETPRDQTGAQMEEFFARKHVQNSEGPAANHLQPHESLAQGRGNATSYEVDQIRVIDANSSPSNENNSSSQSGLEKQIHYTSEGKNFTRIASKPARHTFVNKDLNELPESYQGEPVDSQQAGRSDNSSLNESSARLENSSQDLAEPNGLARHRLRSQLALRSTRSPSAHLQPLADEQPRHLELRVSNGTLETPKRGSEQSEWQNHSASAAEYPASEQQVAEEGENGPEFGGRAPKAPERQRSFKSRRVAKEPADRPQAVGARRASQAEQAGELEVNSAGGPAEDHSRSHNNVAEQTAGGRKPNQAHKRHKQQARNHKHQPTRRPQVTEAHFSLRDLPLKAPTAMPSLAETAVNSIKEVPVKAKRLKDNQVDKHELMNELLTALDRVKAAIYKLQPLTARMNAIYRKSVTSNTRNIIMDNHKGTYSKRYPPGDYDDTYDRMHPSELIDRPRSMKRRNSPESKKADKRRRSAANEGSSSRLSRQGPHNRTARATLADNEPEGSTEAAVYLPAPSALLEQMKNSTMMRRSAELQPLRSDLNGLQSSQGRISGQISAANRTARAGLSSGSSTRNSSDDEPDSRWSVVYDDEGGDFAAGKMGANLWPFGGDESSPSRRMGRQSSAREADGSSLRAQQGHNETDDEGPLFGYRITIYQAPVGSGEDDDEQESVGSSGASIEKENQMLSYRLLGSLGGNPNEAESELTLGGVQASGGDGDSMVTSESSLAATSRSNETTSAPASDLDNGDEERLGGESRSFEYPFEEEQGESDDDKEENESKKSEMQVKQKHKKQKKEMDEEAKQKKEEKKAKGEKKGEKKKMHVEKGKRAEEEHKKKKEFKKIKHSKGVMSKESHKLHRDKHIKAHDRGAAKEKALKERTQIEFFEREQIVDDEFEKGKKSLVKAGWAGGHDSKKTDYHSGNGASKESMYMSGSHQRRNGQPLVPVEQIVPAESRHHMLETAASEPSVDKTHGYSVESSSGKQSNKFEKKHIEAKGKKFKGWREKGYKIITETEFIDRGSLHDSAYKKRDKGAAHHQKFKKHEAKSEGHHGSMHEHHKKMHKKGEKKMKSEEHNKEAMKKEEAEKEKKKLASKKEALEKKKKEKKDKAHDHDEAASSTISTLKVRPTNNILGAPKTSQNSLGQANERQEASWNGNTTAAPPLRRQADFVAPKEESKSRRLGDMSSVDERHKRLIDGEHDQTHHVKSLENHKSDQRNATLTMSDSPKYVSSVSNKILYELVADALGKSSDRDTLGHASRRSDNNDTLSQADGEPSSASMRPKSAARVATTLQRPASASSAWREPKSMDTYGSDKSHPVDNGTKLDAGKRLALENQASKNFEGPPVKVSVPEKPQIRFNLGGEDRNLPATQQASQAPDRADSRGKLVDLLRRANFLRMQLEPLRQQSQTPHGLASRQMVDVMPQAPRSSPSTNRNHFAANEPAAMDELSEHLVSSLSEPHGGPSMIDLSSWPTLNQEQGQLPSGLYPASPMADLTNGYFNGAKPQNVAPSEFQRPLHESNPDRMMLEQPTFSRVTPMEYVNPEAVPSFQAGRSFQGTQVNNFWPFTLA